MKYLFYFGHPAQYLFLRATIKLLIAEEKNTVLILIKSKDVLEDLLIADGLQYQNILVKNRKQGKLAILFSLIQRMVIMLPIIRHFKPNLMISTDASIAQLGFFMQIKRITIVEDDYSIIKTLARLTYPFTGIILCPNVCDVGPWHTKKVGYNGYMKLGYLHPDIFKLDGNICNYYNLTKPFVLIRMAQLTAHHDAGVEGLSNTLVGALIKLSNDHGRAVYITTEAALPSQFEPYGLKIKPTDIHHILAAADLLVSDSQSMSVEAAILGTPSIRYSSFAGRISVLEELEHTFDLTYGIKPGKTEQLLSKAHSLLSNSLLKLEFTEKKKAMLSEKVNVTTFVHAYLTNYVTDIN
jgi:predicted glycosyltransferase